MNIALSLVSSIIAKSSALIAWFKLLTTDPANSTPTKGATVFSRATGGTAFDANGLLVSYAPNVPRYQDGGLLIEQKSTNLCTRYAVAIRRSAVPRVLGIAPDGTVTAENFVKNAVTDSSPIGWFTLGTPTAVGTVMTVSLYMKPIGGGASYGLYSPMFGAINMPRPELDPNAVYNPVTGYYRVQTQVTSSGNAGNLLIYHNSFSTSTGNGIDGNYIWGAQVEAGSKATSLIKTFGAPVTRDADVCYTATANIPTLANGATFVWRGALPNDGLIHEAVATKSAYVIIRRHSNGNVTAYVGGILMGGVAGIDTAIRTFSLRTNGSNLHELLIDGVVAITSTATGLVQPTVPLYVGSWNGSIHYLNDSIQSFAMYDKRLTDAEIQGLG